VSLLNWRLRLESASGTERMNLHTLIAEAEAKLLAWERIHHDD